LYYGILAVGLVLVLISSILFNVCINHKCKKEGLKIFVPAFTVSTMNVSSTDLY
jgi:hypothetical protein